MIKCLSVFLDCLYNSKYRLSVDHTLYQQCFTVDRRLLVHHIGNETGSEYFCVYVPSYILKRSLSTRLAYRRCYKIPYQLCRNIHSLANNIVSIKLIHIIINYILKRRSFTFYLVDGSALTIICFFFFYDVYYEKNKNYISKTSNFRKMHFTDVCLHHVNFMILCFKIKLLFTVKKQSN